MNHIRHFGLAISLVLVLIATIGLDSRSVHAQNADSFEVNLKEEGTDRTIVELLINDYQLESGGPAGEAYTSISIPGMASGAAPGMPIVPSYGMLLGVPYAADLSLNVLKSEYDTLYGHKIELQPLWLPLESGDDALVPVTYVEPFVPPGGDAYPSVVDERPLVMVGEQGLVRDQPVAQLRFYPVQYEHETEEVRIYRRILVEVVSTAGAEAQSAADQPLASPYFEDVLRSQLVNYGSLSRPDGALTMEEDNGRVANIPAAAADQKKLRIEIAETGLYTLTYDDLVNAGFELVGVDPKKLQLSTRGNECAIYLHGMGDGTFDASDYILFYATQYEDLYTDRNVYWLAVGDTNGKRMTTQDGTPSSATVAQQFRTVAHFEEDTNYWIGMQNGAGEDHWFWQTRFGPNAENQPTFRTYVLDIPAPSSVSETASVSVRLKGVTSLDHRTQILWNGNKIDDQTWQGQVVYDHNATTPQGTLLEGANELVVQTVDTGAEVDQIYANWIEVGYWRTYAVVSDAIAFKAPAAGTWKFVLPGFSTDVLWLLDVSDPLTPALIEKSTTQPQGAGFALQFTRPAQADTEYYATTQGAVLVPESIETVVASDWRSPTHEADYIIIAYDEFAPNTIPLADARKADGLRVETIKVSELYDEFNHGIFNPSAIRDFLAYAYSQWTPPAPAFVVLVGDATLDYKDDLLQGNRTFVPTQIFDHPTFGQAPSDNWFVAIAGDDILPDMHIGRLSGRTALQVDNIIAKIIDYDTQPTTAAWNTTALLVTDDGVPLFDSVTDSLAARIPYYFDDRRVDVDKYPPGSPSDDITSNIQKGVVLLNYTGHGDTVQWGVWQGGNIYDKSHVSTLSNADKLPVVTVANCLNGFFAGTPQFESMAEEFQRRPNGGAVAVFAPSSLGYALGHRSLMEGYYDAIFQDDLTRLGPAAMAAKMAVYARSEFWSDLVETYILFGDPFTALAVPTNYPYVRSTSPANQEQSVALDKSIQIALNKPMDKTTVTLTGSDLDGLNLTPTWNGQGNLVTYSHTGLKAGKTYQITVQGKDLQGNELGAGTAPKTWSFAAAEDTVAPTVILRVEQASPAPGTLPVLIHMDFNEPMRIGSLAYSVSPDLNSEDIITWDASGTNAVVSFTDSGGAGDGQVYTFSLTEGKDLAGNDLAQPAQTSFSLESRVYLPALAR